jgi:hypothetical protein
MEKVREYAPLALKIVGLGLLWTMRAAGFTVLLAVVLAWNLFRIAFMWFFFGRFPRSMVRVFD